MSAPLVADILLLLRPLYIAKLFLLVLTTMTLLPAQAQLLDSIGMFLEEPPRIQVRMDGRGSFISNSAARFLGIKVGLEHAKRVQYGIGYSFLTTPIERLREVEEEGITRTVTTRMRMGYFTPYFEYAFYQRGRVEVRIPVQIGIGSGTLKYEGLDGKNELLQRSLLLLYEPAMTVHYRFWKYAAIGGGVGFRMVARTSAGLGETLTAPIYLFGLKVIFGDMWRDIQQGSE